MNRTDGTSAMWAMILGTFLLIEGVWGMTSPVVFGVLTTNMLHAAIHIVLGIAGLYTGMKGGSRGWCLLVGGILVVVGVLRFVPVVGDILQSLLAVNATVAIFNIVVGLVTIVVARMSTVAPVAKVESRV